MTTLDNILTRHDRGESVQSIALAEGVTLGYVYGILRLTRPNRTRKPRVRTSELRRTILGLHSQGIKVGRIAFLCQCSRAYIYKLLQESSND